MLVTLFMAVSLFSHAKQVRHHFPPPTRQTRGRLGGQNRPSAPLPAETASSKLFVLTSPPTSALPPPVSALPPLPAPALPLPAPALPLPHPLMPLTTPLKLTLQPPEEQEEEDLIAAINHERTQCSLTVLVLDPLLSTAARAHSREMCDRHYFDHQSPTDGQQTPMDRYLAALRNAGEGRPRQIALGENIFFASQSDGQENAKLAHQSLMASPGHRANILQPRFTKVGVGYYGDSTGQFWVTEMFLQDN